MESAMASRVLIIDDEPDVRLYLKMVLEQNDFDVMTATSVHEGYERLTEQIPDLVCLDIMMPKESGIRLYRQMKENVNLKGVPVLIISGVATNRDFDFRSFVSDESVPPPDAYLEKPIHVEEFLKTVTSLTERANRSSVSRGGNRAR